MAEGSYKRKLAAVFSADVAGYSRLMGEDEAATVKTLETYKRVMSELICQHRGRVVDSPGDNVLAEFASVVDAVQCAVAAQNEFKARNAELPESRRMQFRIGINLGDVIEEEERIYGDGVNIAARLESLADPGGICVSKTAFDHIESKLPLGYQFLGEQTVKNIAKPVGAYKVLMEARVIEAEAEKAARRKAQGAWRKPMVLGLMAAVIVIIGAAAVWQFALRPPRPAVEKADPKKMVFPLPEKPSIAVLPFDNLSSDSRHEYLGDAIAETIITTLSKVPKLFVIARNSTSVYKGKPVKVQQVSEELGVRYVLEGSFQTSGEQVRITAQLIDATTGHHLWAERYSRNLKDLFALQDDITMRIVTALQVKLTEGEQARMWGQETRNMQAYEKIMEAYGHILRPTKEGISMARRLAREALELDPGIRCGYRMLAFAEMLDVFLGVSKSPEQSFNKASEFYQEALALDESDGTTHAGLGQLLLWMRQYDKGISECERAIYLAPNNSEAHACMALGQLSVGNHGQAITSISTAIRLNPMPHSNYFQYLSSMQLRAGQYEQAVTSSKKALGIQPGSLWAQVDLAAAYSLLGQEERAREEAARVLEIFPGFSVGTYVTWWPYKNRSDAEFLIAPLRKAGLK